MSDKRFKVIMVLGCVLPIFAICFIIFIAVMYTSLYLIAG